MQLMFQSPLCGNPPRLIIYEYIYVMVFNGDTLVKNFRVYLVNR